MGIRASVLIAVAMGRMIALAQSLSDENLAHQLANDSTRPSAVAGIVASGSAKVPLLLSWTRNHPAQMNEYELHRLYVGLADVFGQLKTKEAIPFLIKNISLQRWPFPNVWMKAPEVIEEGMPAVRALIQIGPDAFSALIHDPWGPAAPEDRLPVIFAVSRIASAMKDSKEGREYLHTVLGEANMERFWASEGLKLLDGHH